MGVCTLAFSGAAGSRSWGPGRGYSTGQRGNCCCQQRSPRAQNSREAASQPGPGRRPWEAGRLHGLNTMEHQSPSPYSQGLSFWHAARPSASRRSLIPSPPWPPGRAASGQCPSSRPPFLNPCSADLELGVRGGYSPGLAVARWGSCLASLTLCPAALTLSLP